MRQHAQSWLIKSVLWLVVAAFVGTIFYSWGMGEYAERQGVVAEVFDEKISYEEYRETLDNLYNLYRNSTQGRNVDVPHSQLKRTAINSVIQKKLILNEARKMGIEVSDGEIIDRIRKIPAFQNESRFDKDYYQNFLEYNRIRPKDFENSQRTAILTEKIGNLVRSSVKASKQELREAYEWKHEKINMDYLVILPDLFEGKEEISEDKISEHFKNEKEKFRKADQIKIEYIFADPASFEKDVKIGEQNVENYYKDHLDEYMVNESVRASHILIKKLPESIDVEADEKMRKKIEEDYEKQKEEAKGKAENILAELKKDGNFEELAIKHSEDDSNAKSGGDLGFFSRGGMIKEFENVAFSTKVGEISDIVETIYGYHIIKVTEKKETRTKPLSEVKDDIHQKLLERKSKKLAKRSLLKFSKSPDPIGEFKNFSTTGSLKKEITDLFSMKSQEIPLIGTSSEFKAEAFSLKENEISRLVETFKGYYLLRLLEKKASYVPELDEVRDEVTKSLSELEKDKIAKKEAQRLQEELNTGKPIDNLAGELGTEVSHTLFFDREEAINKFGMNRSLIEAAFKLKEKEAAVVPVSGKYYVIYMVERTGFDEKKYAEEKDTFSKTFLENKGSKVLDAWVANLRKNAKVTINEQFL